MPFLQNCLVNFCNLFSVNLENFPMKGNLKQWIFFFSFTWFCFTRFVHVCAGFIHGFIRCFQSFFINIPLRETIDIAVKLILENKKDLKFSENELTKLFRFATSQTHFYFDGKIFDQADGVAMGSPL